MIELSSYVRALIGLLGLAIVVVGFGQARAMSVAATRPMLRVAITAMAAGGFVLVLASVLATPKLTTTALIWVPSSTLLAQAVAAYYWRALPRSPLSPALSPIEATEEARQRQKGIA